MNVWVRNKNKLTIVASKVQVFKSLSDLVRGLMFEKEAIPTLFVMKKPGVISLHSLFCCTPLDIIVLDEHKKVIFVKQRWMPWGKLKYVDVNKPAKYVLELPVGSIAGSGVKVGHTLQFCKTRGE